LHFKKYQRCHFKWFSLKHVIAASNPKIK
jgi:hypothetical protein